MANTRLNTDAEKDLNLLRNTCPYLPLSDGQIQIFQFFFCPVSIVEADVKEYVIDEYDSVELFILRLYAAGIRYASRIYELTGIDENMIQKILASEKYTFGHIDPVTGEITEAGRATLDENKDVNNLFQHALYNVKREMHVDAITGTIIKADAEMPKIKMAVFNDRMKPTILPRDSVVVDDELTREIKDRLQVYLDKNYFSDSDTIQNIQQIHTKEVRYRAAYFVKLYNFKYPFIAIRYSLRHGNNKEFYVEPICISQTDFERISDGQNDVTCIVRDDNYLEYLDSLINEFNTFSNDSADAVDEIIKAEEEDVETEETIKQFDLNEETFENESDKGDDND